MDEIGIVSGLDILTYLKKNGVKVNDDLCRIVPETVTEQEGKTKTVCVIDRLIDDTTGALSGHFPDYYNTFPESTTPGNIRKLRSAFQRFVQQILFGERIKEHSQLTNTPESDTEKLGQDIDSTISTLRGEWLHWSINNGYETILEGMEVLLPLLHEKYQNPMLSSEAQMMDENITDTIPDEYIIFLYDILIMLCSVFNTKYEQLQTDATLWSENKELIDNINYTAGYLYYDLGWEVFDYILQENKFSLNYLTRELIKGTNIINFSLKERSAMEKRAQDKPTQEG